MCLPPCGSFVEKTKNKKNTMQMDQSSPSHHPTAPCLLSKPERCAEVFVGLPSTAVGSKHEPYTKKSFLSWFTERKQSNSHWSRDGSWTDRLSSSHWGLSSAAERSAVWLQVKNKTAFIACFYDYALWCHISLDWSKSSIISKSRESIMFPKHSVCFESLCCPKFLNDHLIFLYVAPNQ